MPVLYARAAADLPAPSSAYREGDGTLEPNIQRMRLIVNGAVCLYEGEGLEIAQVLRDQGRDELLAVLDGLMTAMYWLQDMLADQIGEKT